MIFRVFEHIYSIGGEAVMSRIIGSILLIIAISIGGGLLSLPVVTAAGGFIHSSLLLIAIWLVMTIAAFFVLEVCLWLPKDTNLVAMSKHTLGTPGQLLTWFFYLVMLYCIICVYISGGTDLIHSIWQSLHVNVPNWVSTILFVVMFGSIVWCGIKLIDYTNRALMTGKIIVYFLLIAILVPAVHLNNLPTGSFRALSGAVMPAVFSFGYAIIVPSLRSYLNNNVKQLRWVVLIGSVIPLLCFILWNYVVQGTMTQQHLVAIGHSGQVISQLNAGLSAMGNPWVTTVIHLFTTICVLTAFLAVSLSLSDFIANGLNKQKRGKDKCLIYAFTFLPPLIIIIFWPYIFITAIRYAGIFVVIILILLPTLMVWRGRSNKVLIKHALYKVSGGIWTITLMLIASIAFLLFAVTHL